MVLEDLLRRSAWGSTYNKNQRSQSESKPLCDCKYCKAREARYLTDFEKRIILLDCLMVKELSFMQIANICKNLSLSQPINIFNPHGDTACKNPR